jgi:hypothetical protein
MRESLEALKRSVAALEEELHLCELHTEDMLHVLGEARRQLAWCNEEFGPHASTNVVLKKLDFFIEEGDSE